jgi:hypothetical protein
MDELAKEENNKEFSELCHAYYKLAAMRCMQSIREKHDVPPGGIETLTLAIFGRLLNEAVYAVGAAIKQGMPITDIYGKEHLLNLLKVLNNEPLDPTTRKDIDADIKRSIGRFKEFILENGPSFRI